MKIEDEPEEEDDDEDEEEEGEEESVVDEAGTLGIVAAINDRETLDKAPSIFSLLESNQKRFGEFERISGFLV